jgi:hypothetical protein
MGSTVKPSCPQYKPSRSSANRNSAERSSAAGLLSFRRRFTFSLFQFGRA